jgi:hypothetical protein
MKAVRTEGTDTELTLPGAGEDRVLPAQRIQAYDPELGEVQENAHPAFVTTWTFDDGERKAIANGALLELVVHGTGHPPVSLAVGNPTEGAVAMLTKDHVDKAVGFWFAAISERLTKQGFPTDAAEVLEMWHTALEETREGAIPVDLGQRLEAIRRDVEDEMETPAPEDDRP